MKGGDIIFETGVDSSGAVEGIRDSMDDVEESTEGASESAEDYSEKLDEAMKRVEGMAKKLGTALIAMKGLSKVADVARQYFSRLLSTNTEFQTGIKQIKGALATAFQPLYEAVIPALNTVVQLIVSIANAFARFTNMLFGKSTAQSAKNAKALNDQADALNNVGGAAASAEKNLAGFDEINNLNSASGGGGGGGSSSAFDFSGIEQTKAKILELQAVVGSASLAIGVILMFTGHFLLGLGLVALGAVSLWGVATETGSEDITAEVKQQIDAILGIATVSMLAIGILLCCFGHPILGIALIVAAIGTSMAADTFDGGSIVDKVKEIWGKIKSYWNTNIAPKFTNGFWEGVFACIGDGLFAIVKGAINLVIDLINGAIDLINSIGFLDIPAGPFGAWPEIHQQLWNIPKIPMLAQGAVIPPNSPFLAMLGDQSNGTNIEAPLSTIQQAVADVLGSDVLYNAFLRALNDSDAVSRVYIDGKEVSDTVDMYSRRRSRANGG